MDSTTGNSPEIRAAVFEALDGETLDWVDLAAVMGSSVSAVRRRRNRGQTPLPPPDSGHGITSRWERATIEDWLGSMRPRGWLKGEPRGPRKVGAEKA